MRGRVGRSTKKHLLFTDPCNFGVEFRFAKAFGCPEEFSELGDGFKVAMRDLDIRGAGNLLGAEQSGSSVILDLIRITNS